MASSSGSGEHTALERPRLDYVRPGPVGLAWLRETIADLKRTDPLSTVTLLVPNAYAGLAACRHLAEHGGYLNVQSLRLSQAAAMIARSSLSAGKLLTSIVEENAVRQAAREQSRVFGAVEHRSLLVALGDLFRLLRRREVVVDAISNIDDLAPVTRAAFAAYRDFEKIREDYDDLTRITNAATARLAQARSCPSGLSAMGALVLFLPTRFDPADARFLAAASRWVPLRAAFAHLADPRHQGDESGHQALELLAREIGMAAPARPEPPRSLALSANVRVVRTPDPTEEVREVARSIARDLESTGTPLYRVAILYRQTDPYAALARDTLDAAGLPWAASEGQRLNQSRPGRALLGLLALPERRFARSAVMSWLETGPPLAILQRVAPSRWDRLSRRAGVVRGADQWQSRLQSLAAHLSDQRLSRERDGASDSALSALRHDADAADELAAFIGELAEALAPPAERGSWRLHVDWATGLLDRFVGQEEDWPAEQRPFVRDVADTLASLIAGDDLDDVSEITLSTFLGSLEAALGARSRPVGRLGHGIFLGPVSAVTGLAFDRVYVLGMTEGAFPPPPPADPFFPPGGPDPLSRRSGHRQAERQAFLTALASGDGGDVILHVPDSDGGRATLPSRWLLEVASRCEDAELDASAFDALDPDATPWLRVVRSAEAGAHHATAPTDLHDRRLSEAIKWFRSGRRLERHPLARRGELPLGAGLTSSATRRSRVFSAHDGNVSALAGQANRIDRMLGRSSPMSATAIETWAGCPFRYFLAYVLGVEPTERPEETWTIDALERGSLVHGILEQYFSRLIELAAPGPVGPATVDLNILHAIAEDQFRHSESRGVTGHPLAWEIQRRSIRANLEAFLENDASWRREMRVAPAYLEQRFGFRSDVAWPAVDVRAEDATMRFRGLIDRVDMDRSNRRAWVTDYKTGSAKPYEGIEQDPVLAGQHIQLALYTRAARAVLGDDWQVDGAFWFVSASGRFQRLEIPDERAKVDERLESVVSTVAGGIRAGAFPQVPGEEEWSAEGTNHRHCRLCDFQRVCPNDRSDLRTRKQDQPLAQIYAQLAIPQESGS
jgi:ATP-dependent helicase/nuclease subunit B